MIKLLFFWYAVYSSSERREGNNENFSKMLPGHNGNIKNLGTYGDITIGSFEFVSKQYNLHKICMFRYILVFVVDIGNFKIT